MSRVYLQHTGASVCRGYHHRSLKSTVTVLLKSLFLLVMVVGGWLVGWLVGCSVGWLLLFCLFFPQPLVFKSLFKTSWIRIRQDGAYTL